jgi:hypothetical protein
LFEQITSRLAACSNSSLIVERVMAAVRKRDCKKKIITHAILYFCPKLPQLEKMCDKRKLLERNMPAKDKGVIYQVLQITYIT